MSGGREKPALLLAGGRPGDPAASTRMMSRAFRGMHRPSVAYIGTANGDSPAFFRMMASTLKAAGAAEVLQLALATEKPDLEAVRDALAGADVIFLAGGEVEDGMYWLRKHKLTAELKRLYGEGKQFVGVSAGSIMMGTHWVRWEIPEDDSSASLFDCLGIIPLLFDTHGEEEDWIELKAALTLMGDKVRGYGLPHGGMVSADSRGNLVNLDKEVLVFRNRGGQIRRDEEKAFPAGKLLVGISFNLKKEPATDIAAAVPDAEAEYDDRETVLALQAALEETGCAVELYEADTDFLHRLSLCRPDIMFNIAEGRNGRGREAQVPAILHFLGIPFTGSDETAMCLTLDKALAKQIAASCGADTPRFRLAGFKPAGSGQPAVSGSSAPIDDGLSYPLIVKPNAEGSGKGISGHSIVKDASALARVLNDKLRVYEQDMLVEEYIPGREFTVGILGNGEKLRVFPPMEILFGDKAGGIYSYAVKRNFREHVRYECPARIPDELERKITRMAEKIFHGLGCKDFARLDFRLSPEGRLYFLELNPLPGLAPGYGDLPILAGLCGLSYPALIREILNSALARYGLPHRV